MMVSMTNGLDVTSAAVITVAAHRLVKSGRSIGADKARSIVTGVSALDGDQPEIQALSYRFLGGRMVGYGFWGGRMVGYGFWRGRCSGTGFGGGGCGATGFRGVGCQANISRMPRYHSLDQHVV